MKLLQLKKNNALLKRYSLIVLFLLQMSLTFSQNLIEFDESDTILLDHELRHGKLENGFTYYLRPTEYYENKAHIELVVKAGYNRQNEDQIELAHLLEHMLMRSTKQNPDVKLFLAKHGLKVQASTQDNNVSFHLTNLPTDSVDLFDSIIQLFRDWSQGGANFDPNALELEKNAVILELEPETKNFTFPQQWFNEMFPSSLYYEPSKSTRLNQVRKHNVNDLKRFYRDWYRPELEALIVVGDINVDKMEMEIKRTFGDLERSKKAIYEPKPTRLPTNARTKYLIESDQNRKNVIVWDFHLCSRNRILTFRDLRESMIGNLYINLTNNRLKQLDNNSEWMKGLATRFLPSYGFFGHFGLLQTQMVIDPSYFKENFIKVMAEHERVKRYGFSTEELVTAKNQMKAKWSKGLSSFERVGSYLEHFLFGTMDISWVCESQIIAHLLEEITPTDVQKKVMELLIDDNRHIMVSAPGKDNSFSSVKDTTILKWLSEVERMQLKPLPRSLEGIISKPLMNEEEITKLFQPRMSSIRKSSVTSLGITMLELPNGINVILKQLRDNTNRFYLLGIKKGGKEQYAKGELVSASYAADIMKKSGLGPYNGKDLDQFLKMHGVEFGSSIGEGKSQISGFGGIAELEILLQAIYLSFTKAKIDEDIFELWKSELQLKINAEEEKTTPDSRFIAIFNGNTDIHNTSHYSPTTSDLQALDADDILEVYCREFSNNGNFTFFLSGDFNLHTVIPVLIKYLSTIPNSKTSIRSVESNLSTTQQEKKKQDGFIIYDKNRKISAKVRLAFTGRFENKRSDQFALRILDDLLTFKLKENLRRNKGIVYTIGVSSATSPQGGGQFCFSISFDCNANRVEEAIKYTWEEINYLKEGNADRNILESSKNLLKDGIRNNIRDGQFWNDYLSHQVLQKRDFEEILHYPAIIDSLTFEVIQETSKKYLTKENYTSFSLLPKQNESIVD